MIKRMKTRNIFMSAVMALSLAACSNEEDGGSSSNPLVDGVTIAFVSDNAPGTRAFLEGDKEGVGTENAVYEAYVFAREVAPTHADAQPGDWTVVQVKGAEGAPIQSGSAKGTLGAAATFSGVRQGENVYVIANDPTMTLAIAQKMAHSGVKSEQQISGYIAKLSKEYIGGLSYQEDKDAAVATGKFMMAGKGVVPAIDRSEPNATVTVPINLNREMARVKFTALVTTDKTQEAYGKVAFQKGDGIVVVRASREASCFSLQAPDFYMPGKLTEVQKNYWPDASDLTDVGSAPFNGLAGFNVTSPAATVLEYRYSWVLGDGNYSTDATKKMEANNIYHAGSKMISPVFYVLPNYSGDSNSCTTISTQATYIGENTVYAEVGKVVTANYSALLATTGASAAGFPAADKLSTITWTKAQLDVLLTYLTSADNKAAIAAALCEPGSDATLQEDAYNKFYDKYVTPAVSNSEYFREFVKNQKVFYRANITNVEQAGVTPLYNTERNVYYQIQGTITSLGEQTLGDAATTGNSTMIVSLTVKNWKWSETNIDM